MNTPTNAITRTNQPENSSPVFGSVAWRTTTPDGSTATGVTLPSTRATSERPSIASWPGLTNRTPKSGGIFDYDDFGDLHVGEYDTLEQVSAVACGIVAHGPAFATWAEMHDGNPDMLAQFDDCFIGTYDSPTDWARDVLDGSGIEEALDRAVPADLRAYVQFDYDGLARDLQLGGDVHIETAPDGKVWLFRVI